ncbi:MAG: methyltransferase domain-containing protein [Acidimicrobiia bacterium]
MLDSGGGRGSHAAVFAGRGSRVVVLDPSKEMAGHASGVEGVSAVQGSSLRMPFASGVFQLVYFHLSLHYGGWERSVGEAVRVVRPGGVVWIWTFPPDHLASSFLTRWFPSVTAIDAARFPAPGLLSGRLVELGLEPLSEGDTVESVSRRAGAWEQAVRAGFVSTLQLLGPAEIERGLEAFRMVYPDPDATVSYDLRFSWVAARRRALA